MVVSKFVLRLDVIRSERWEPLWNNFEIFSIFRRVLFVSALTLSLRSYFFKLFMYINVFLNSSAIHFLYTFWFASYYLVLPVSVSSALSLSLSLSLFYVSIVLSLFIFEFTRSLLLLSFLSFGAIFWSKYLLALNCCLHFRLCLLLVLSLFISVLSRPLSCSSLSLCLFLFISLFLSRCLFFFVYLSGESLATQLQTAVAMPSLPGESITTYLSAKRLQRSCTTQLRCHRCRVNRLQRGDATQLRCRRAQANNLQQNCAI